MQQRRTDLPDDHEDAMFLLRGLLHFPDINDKDLEPAELVRVAILADKYDCLQAARSAGEAYLMRWANKPPGTYLYRGDYCDLTAAAYLLRLNKLLALFTRRLILDQTAPFSRLLEDESGAVFPTMVLCG